MSSDASDATPLPPLWKVVGAPFILAVFLWASFALTLRNLDHTAFTRWDEVFHAVVAQNVMKHPHRPTLVDAPYLPYDMKKWGENHVWLHKPILPFWQMALSLALFGVNTFALRLPSAVLNTGACIFTYLIGIELFDRRTGLVAAVLQAANPFLVTLVHGYIFADHIDIALLFWVEVALYFLVRSLRTGSWRDIVLAGVVQGLAFLCKSYLAGIILGIALSAWLLPICRLGKRDDFRIGPLRILAMLGASVLTVGPWLLYCLCNYPQELWQEETQIWTHLSGNIEGWAAPWDRVVFDYLIAIHGVFYTPALVAGVVLIGKALAERNRGLLLTYAWALGVVVPHLFAVTKTPSATVLALPAACLLLACLIAEASRGQGWALAALSGVLLMSLVMPAVVRSPGYGYPGNSREFGVLMFQAMWVLYHVLAALGIIAVFAVAWLLTRNLTTPGWERARLVLRIIATVFCAGALAWLGFRTIGAAWEVTSRDLGDPSSVAVGEFAHAHLPENAVLFCEEPRGYEHLTIMFYADRTCYPFQWNARDRQAAQVVQAGGIPYIVARRNLPLPVEFNCPNRGPTIYRWQPP